MSQPDKQLKRLDIAHAVWRAYRHIGSMRRYSEELFKATATDHFNAAAYVASARTLADLLTGELQDEYQPQEPRQLALPLAPSARPAASPGTPPRTVPARPGTGGGQR